jgi:hypothetical protein
MWLEGHVWKPGPAYPATVAAWPLVWWFRISILREGVFFLLLLTLDAGGVQAMGGGAEARGN